MEWINGIIKKIKELIIGQERKKLIENSAIAIIIGVIIIIAGSVMLKPSRKKEEPDDRQHSQQINAIDPYESSEAGGDLETRLKALLVQVEGVGKVDVMITYSTSKENVPAYDIKKSGSATDEQDSEGGSRKVRQEDYDSTLVYEDSPAGGKKPVVLKQLEPEVKGVLVVAEGADQVEVRNRICKAVTVVLSVPMHKVEVIQRKK